MIAVREALMMGVIIAIRGGVRTGGPFVLVYEVSFSGVASETICAAFEGFELKAGADTTTVRCSKHDLNTVIARSEGLGLELVGVRLIADQDKSHRGTVAHGTDRGDRG